MVCTRTTKQTVAELNEIQDAGVNLEEAVVSLHKKEGVGQLFIYPAIMKILGIDKREAKKLMIRWIGPSV